MLARAATILASRWSSAACSRGLAAVLEVRHLLLGSLSTAPQHHRALVRCDMLKTVTLCGLRWPASRMEGSARRAKVAERTLADLEMKKGLMSTTGRHQTYREVQSGRRQTPKDITIIIICTLTTITITITRTARRLARSTCFASHRTLPSRSRTLPSRSRTRLTTITITMPRMDIPHTTTTTIHLALRLCLGSPLRQL